MSLDRDLCSDCGAASDGHGHFGLYCSACAGCDWSCTCRPMPELRR